MSSVEVEKKEMELTKDQRYYYLHAEEKNVKRKQQYNNDPKVIARRAERERIKAEKEAEKEAKKAEKEAEKEAKKAEKEAEKAAAKAAKEAEKEAKKASATKPTTKAVVPASAVKKASPAPVKATTPAPVKAEAPVAPKKTKPVTKVEEIPADGMVHPWTHGGKKYLRNSDGETWTVGADGGVGNWVGLYNSTTNKIDTSAPAPVFEEDE